MIIWIKRENALENAPAKVDPPVTSVSTDRPYALMLRSSATVLDRVLSTDVLRSHQKALSTLAAQFALVGRELRTIVKEGRTYFEVRRWDECFTCSTEADVRGLLRQFRGAA